MLQNYISITLRNLRRQGLYAFLNIFGLSVGIASCLLIVLYIVDELRYDTFHSQADQLYRVVVDDQVGGNELQTSLTPSPLAPAIHQDVPEVASVLRYYPYEQLVFQAGDQSFTEDVVAFVGENFFQMFGYKLLEGDPKTALKNPGSLVLSETTAKKYFGDYSALGKLITVGNEKTYEVTGIVEDPPDHSHLSFEVLASLSSLPDYESKDWTTVYLYTYLLLQENADVEAVEAKLNDFAEKQVLPQMGEVYGVDVQASSGKYRFLLQPVTDIHLRSNLFGDLLPGGSVTTLYVLFAIAFFVLMIACVNFMNLSTARYMRRAREVGVRKTLGSTRQALVIQFLSEATMMSLVATILAVGWALLALPSFNTMAGKEVPYRVFTEGWLIGGLMLLVLVVGVLAGSYPAFFLSGFRPTEVLKGGWVVRKGSTLLRNVLVVFQFTISIGLIICTALTYQQIAYTRSKDLGFDKEHVMAVSHMGLLGEQTESVKQAIANQAAVIQTSVVSNIIPRSYSATAFWPKGSHRDHLLYWYTADYDHLETMGITLVEGRNFSREFSTDTSGVLLNEEAVRVFELEEPIGAEISYDENATGTYRVLGVMKDFNFESLHNEIKPLAVFISEPGVFLLVRLAPGNLAEAIHEVETVWQEKVPHAPFEYTFLDEEFDRKFRTEQHLSRVFLVFAVLAIVVACLGLLGLAAYAAEQRIKEIGVRKTMGASTGNLVWLLSKDFAKLVLLAFGVAVPIAYFVMQAWLNQFAFRMEMGVMPFLLAGAGALLLACLTVSALAIKAARSNLTEILRPE
ncbi:MAG: ABC transporter permease [Cyclobacteriaceae bacterium]